jgi:serine/threonine-protein kinase
MRIVTGWSTLPGMNGGTNAGSLLGDRYRLTSVLGVGGIAVVWRAHDSVLDRSVAIKVVAGEHGDERARGLLRREARAAAALSHPNIAHVHDYGETVVDGRVLPYVVMEMVPGGTLAQRLAAGPVTVEFAMRVGAQVAAALAAAHAVGLVHQDIKPANVMLPPTGAKVVDFGIAAAVAPSTTGRLADEVLGTPAYLAPERLIDDAVEPASDVYALGILLYRMLSGRSPWTAENTTQMLTAHLYIDPVPLPALPGVPDDVTDLCNRCLAKDPADRPSAQVVAEVLSERAGTAPTPAARPVGRWLAAASLLAVLGGAAGWLAFRHESPAPATDRPVAADPLPPVSAAGSSPAGSPAASRSRGAPATTGGIAPPVMLTVTSATPAPASTAPAGGGTVPATPEPTTTAAPEPEERTFSSPAGTLTATCPSPGTAQILSWRPTPPYKVDSADPGPAPAPEVRFKLGKSRTTMTVTCTGMSPSATVAET